MRDLPLMLSSMVARVVKKKIVRSTQFTLTHHPDIIFLKKNFNISFLFQLVWFCFCCSFNLHNRMYNFERDLCLLAAIMLKWNNEEQCCGGLDERCVFSNEMMKIMRGKNTHTYEPKLHSLPNKETDPLVTLSVAACCKRLIYI